MNASIKRTIILIIALVFALPIKSVTSISPASSGARSMALGGSMVALSDLYSPFNNQAGIADIKHTVVSFSYQNRFLVKELGINQISIIKPSKYGTFSASHARFGFSEFGLSTTGLCYARKFGEKLSAAMQFDLLTLRMSPLNGTKYLPTAEIGIRYKAIEKLHIGFHLFNIAESKFKLSTVVEPVPIIARGGLSFAADNNTLVVAEIRNSSIEGVSFCGGVEYSILEKLVVRAGTASNPTLVSGGLSIIFQHFDVGISYQMMSGFGNNIGCSFSWQL